MCAHADRASALAVDRNDGLGGNLPRTRHIRQSRIHRGSGFFSARRIERKFNEGDELMHWFILGKLAGRIAAGEIEHAVLEREPDRRQRKNRCRYEAESEAQEEGVHLCRRLPLIAEVDVDRILLRHL